jgi:hypothetical protein
MSNIQKKTSKQSVFFSQIVEYMYIPKFLNLVTIEILDQMIIICWKVLFCAM